MNDEDKFLKNKKIFFIGIGFYDYDKYIIQNLNELGADVTYYKSSIPPSLRRIKNSGFSRLGNSLINRKKNNKFREYKDNDIILVIKGENLTEEDFKLLKEKNPNAKFILYLWDDLARIENKEILLKEISNIYSFDYEDCNKYGFKFRPLFYRVNNQTKIKPIFISSIGWYHSDRLNYFRQAKEFCLKNKLPYYLKLYTSPKIYFIERFIKKTLTAKDNDLFIFKPLPYKKTIQITGQSQYVLDVTHQSQNGLSMRSIEALKLGCHLLTTNKVIEKHKDISSNFYTIIRKDNFITTINKNCEESNLTENYNIDNFLNQLLKYS